jgi:hypothetical protein
LAAATGSTAAYFFCAAALNVAGILCWFRMRSVAGAEAAAAIMPHCPVGETK